MAAPVQITFRNMEPSPAVEARLRAEANALERYFPAIMSCHVTVEAPHRHQHKGKLYQVRIKVSAPGREIVAGHDPSMDHAHEDVAVAVRDAFAAVRRQLEDYIHVLRAR